MNDHKAYLVYIIQTLDRIRHLTEQGRLYVESDEHAPAALLFYLHTLAEATQRLPSALTAKHSEIPWERIAGFRNRIVHGYLSVDWEIVWGIVDTQLDLLYAAVEDLLQTLEDDPIS